MQGLDLTSREIEVLRLRPTSMTQLQMAAHLYVEGLRLCGGTCPS